MTNTIEIPLPGESAIAVAARGARDDARRLTVGAVAYTATLSSLTVAETINGVTVTATISGNTITEVYGAPISETWVTTISGGTVVKELV